ncbi:MAG: transcriptional regulator, Crp/Fnr family [Chitinophagaceae bacterium]|jgi:CRP-like cAMP-binding protein|nr:transcriptional regulator, Crp/Fnr family [Chitinophagaceae bacterium]
MIDTDILLTYGGTYKKVQKGEVIFREGGSALFYHQLVEGRVRWINVDDDGREIIQHIIEPGECFGELPLFDTEPYAASAVADEECLLIRLHHSTFGQLLKDQPTVMAAFTRLLSQRLRFKFMLVKELSSYSPGHRIIALINYMKKNKINMCPKCNKLLLTRQQLANMTGLRVETVIRAIKELEEKKFLSIQKGKVYC